MDEKFRAFDKQTGDLLWEVKLPAGGYATPATYMVGGQQYIVIAAGGGGKPGTKPGDSYLAFTLPNKNSTMNDNEDIMLNEATLSDGAQLYVSRCATCHQYDGLGIGENFPPLINSEWVAGDKDRLIKVVLGGLTGDIKVNDRLYNGSMPPWGDFLNDQQVASILTYIRSSWGNNALEISPDEVQKVRKSMGNISQMWTAKDLEMN